MGYYLWFSNKVKGLISKERCDYLFIPYLDYFNFWLGLFGMPVHDIKWSGIVISSIIGHEEIGIEHIILQKSKRMQIYSFTRLLKNSNMVFTILEPLYLYFTKYNKSLSNKIKYIPDPIPDLKGIIDNYLSGVIKADDFVES